MARRKQQGILLAGILVISACLLASLVLSPGRRNPYVAVSTRSREMLPQELQGKDLGPTPEALFWSSVWVYGRKTAGAVLKTVQSSVTHRISDEITKMVWPKLKKIVMPSRQVKDFSRIRTLVKMLEKGEVIQKHGLAPGPTVSFKKRGCSPRCKPTTETSAGVSPSFLRLTPDGEALVWCKEKDKESVNLFLGAQPVFTASSDYSHMLLQDIMFILKGQETEGFQKSGLPGRDHLCLSIVSKDNQALELQFSSEETRDMWAEALKESLWARNEILSKGLLDERIPRPRGFLKLRFLRSPYLRPVLLAGGLALCTAPLPMRWIATAVYLAAS
ncbi:hypothetical protein AAMO2058_000246300 [Amorphochlora amoebiformis]